MSLSAGNIAFLVMVVAGYAVFMGSVGYAHWVCNRREPKAVPPVPRPVAQEALKVQGDKFSHSMDVAL